MVLRTLVAALASVLCVAGFATPPASAQQAPPTDLALSWGYNSRGQLGTGTTNTRYLPGNVTLPEGVELTALAASGYFSMALTSDGRVLAWGENGFGQLGDGTTTDHLTPVYADIPAGTTITAIDTGQYFSLALTSDGRVLAWGLNAVGQLGDGTSANSSTPVEVLIPDGVQITDISAGSGTGVALTSDGRVLGWGDGVNGEMGNGTTGYNRTPVYASLPPGTEATDVSAGQAHVLALTSDGHALAWGYNSSGELGDGTTTQRYTPVPVDLPAGVRLTAVEVSSYYSLALTADGRVLAWGANNFAQLGDGTTTRRSTPVYTALPAGVRITALSAGVYTELALTANGRVYAWGYNNWGQVGDGTSIQRSTPVLTHLPDNTAVTAIAAGWWHSLALAEPGSSRTTLTAVPTTVAPGAPVTLTAHVTCNIDTPTGNVTFYDGGTALGTEALDASGDATLTTTGLGLGTHTITARYEGDGVCPASVSTPVVVVVEEPSNPSLTLTKQATSSGPFQVGDTVAYTYTATNTGNTPLHGLTVTDNLATGVTCGETTIPVGLSASCRGSHTITTADITPCRPAAGGGCEVTNLAQATAYQLSGTEVASEQATATITVQQQGVSGLTLAKRADTAGPFQPGDTVDYTYTVTNTGDSAVHGLTVTDDRVADVDCGTTTLAAGASTTCHGTYTVTEADATCTRGGADGGYGGHGTTCPVTNTAHATATDTAGDTVTSNTATATIRVSGGGHDGYGDSHGDGYGRGKKKETKTA
ncbi:Ig-like domain repeat protein [Streptomyces sp. NPDC048717]|uniref:RCC1 domain-containing protein n=1 Tax=Streptomyces sp. NPDC048717 TaxID=3154928 RepID=UPI0034349E3E